MCISKIKAFIQRKRDEREKEEAACESRRQAKMAEKKRAYQERKTLIQKYLEDYDKVESDKRHELYQKRQKRAEETNGACPHCGSKNVVHNIRRGKGELHGEGRYSNKGAYTIFGGYSYGSGGGKIDGSYDTLPVNKCQDCGNEWNIAAAEYPEDENAFNYHRSTKPKALLYAVINYYKVKFDPNDVKDECNSLEEKLEKFFQEERSYLIEYQYVPKYMLEYVIGNLFNSDYDYRNWYGGKFRYYSNQDRYSYTFPDHIWEVVKKVVDWKGDGAENG